LRCRTQVWLRLPTLRRYLLSHRDEMLSGVCVAATIDGARPFLIETQSLVSSAVYGTPSVPQLGLMLVG
jgi:DNA replication and repair protein RadA